MQSSISLIKEELYANLFSSIDQRFGENGEGGKEVETYDWIKEKIFDGKDFTYRGNLYEIMVAHTRQILRKIDGKSRNKLPSEEEEEEE